jgi:acetyltransferase-like isoleucine patch superfamily enzyme
MLAPVRTGKPRGMSEWLRPARAELRRRSPIVLAAARRSATRLFLLRARAAAALSDGHVTLDVDPSAFVSAHVRIEVLTGTRTEVVIGPGARIEEGVVLSLRGGRLTIGAATQVRRGTTLVVGGQLVIGSGVVLASAGLTVHCEQQVEIGDLTIIGGHSTLTDSAHLRTPPGEPVHHSLRTSPTRIGRNCWLGAGSVVASGVTIGDQCFVGAGSVVTQDVEPGWLVAGVPARSVRLLEEEG